MSVLVVGVDGRRKKRIYCHVKTTAYQQAGTSTNCQGGEGINPSTLATYDKS